MKKFIKFFPLENVFVIFALISGVFFAFITPPNQVPDEGAHFFSVYRYVHGSLTSPMYSMPVNISSTLGYYYDIFRIDGTFIDFRTYLKSYSENIDLKVIDQFSSGTTYSPILYLPQMIGLGLGLILRLPLLQFFLAGRISSLLFYCVCGYLLLKNFPGPKRSMFVLLTMPTSISLAASYSADTVQNILSFAYIFVIFVAIRSKERISKKEWAIFILLSALLGLTKPISILLIFLSLLIPVFRFKDIKNKFLFTGIQFAINFIFIAGWEIVIIFDRVSHVLNNGIFPTRQLANIIFTPITYLNVLITTLNQDIFSWLVQFVGNFGWLDTRLPLFFYVLFVIVFIFAIIIDLREGVLLTTAQRVILLSTIFLYLLAIFTVMYLTWSPVGDSIVSGVQGRYLIPIFPLVIFFILSFKFYNKLPFANVISFVVFFSIPLILIFSIQAIYLRFFSACGNNYYSQNSNCKQVFSSSDQFPPEQTVGPINKTFTQSFDSECSYLNGFSLLILPDNGLKPGILQIELLDSITKRVILKKDTDATNVDRSQWRNYQFPPQADSFHKQYTLSISPKDDLINSATLGITKTLAFPYKLSGVDFPANLVFSYQCPDGIFFKLRTLLH